MMQSREFSSTLNSFHLILCLPSWQRVELLFSYHCIDIVSATYSAQDLHIVLSFQFTAGFRKPLRLLADGLSALCRLYGMMMQSKPTLWSSQPPFSFNLTSAAQDEIYSWGCHSFPFSSVLQWCIWSYEQSRITTEISRMGKLRISAHCYWNVNLFKCSLHPNFHLKLHVNKHFWTELSIVRMLWQMTSNLWHWV